MDCAGMRLMRVRLWIRTKRISMFAIKNYWRVLAVLAVAATTARPVWGQDGRYGDERYGDERYGDRSGEGGVVGGRGYDERGGGQPNAAAADGARAGQAPPRVAEGALRATEYGPVLRDDGRGNPVRGGGGQAPPPQANGQAVGQPGGQGNRQGNGQGNGQVNGPFQPVAPFQLDPQQQRFIDELLAAWEKHSAGITTFECEFTRWEYMPKFGARNAQGDLTATAISSGVMKYIKPDKGLFHVTDTRVFNKNTGKFEKAADDVGEHWVCDGKLVWVVDARLKEIKAYPIPPEMQGQQIANGPLPFMLFGGEAAKLKARYFLRGQTDPKFAAKEIWLESYPRWAEDAANYRCAHLIMKRADFLPYALRMYSNNGADYTVFEFSKIKINNVFTGDIKPPKVPSDWKLIRQTAQTAR
jgi:TIGR03009 family protein